MSPTAWASRTKVVGVVADGAPGFALSYAARRPISANVADTIADGLAVRTPDARALDAILKGAERLVNVSEDEIRAAMRHFYTDTHNVAEGAGAAGIAALLSGRAGEIAFPCAVVLSGGNIDAAVHAQILKDNGEGTVNG